jgi:uncharacterized protein YqeY
MPKRKLISGVKNVAGELKIQEDMLKDKLKQDVVSALKAGDAHKVSVLRYLISLIDKKELQLPPGQMTAAEELLVVQKEIKNKQETREIYQGAGKHEAVEELDYEIEVVKKYLPKELEESELEVMVEAAIAKMGKNFGAVMKEVMTQVAGRVGGEVVSRVVKSKI